MYRNIRYTLDRGHPLQVPCGANRESYDIAYKCLKAVARPATGPANLTSLTTMEHS